jgi:hypothetical protein
MLRSWDVVSYFALEMSARSVYALCNEMPYPRTLRVLLIASLTLLLALLIAITYHRRRAYRKISGQREIFALAKRRSRESNKPLLVIGDPAPPKTYNGIFGPGYDGGDVCIDVRGCSVDPEKTIIVKARIQDVLRVLPDDSAVIFESEVLEYLQPKDLGPTITDLWRVSGGDLFTSHSNVIDLDTYSRSGQKQAPNPFLVWRTKNTGVMMRTFTAFPPFHNFRFIEYKQKIVDPRRAETYHGAA